MTEWPLATRFLVVPVLAWFASIFFLVSAINRESVMTQQFAAGLGFWVFGALVFVGVFHHSQTR